MKKWTAYLISMLGVLLLLIALNITLFALIAARTGSNKLTIRVDEYSRGVVQQAEAYAASQDVLDQLDIQKAFAILIGGDGRILWSHNKPDDIPDVYTIRDVAAFSRWYLADYPVYTRIREDGLFLVGYEKYSIWKYNLQLAQNTITTEITLFPYVLICNLLILILLPAWITRKWAADKEKKRSEWIAGVSHDIRTPLSIVLGNAEKGSVTEKQCIRIRELVNNLNTENKLETNTGKWNREPVKLAALIRDIVIRYMNSNEDKYSFELDIAPELEEYVLYADKTLIRRMFENIISNSIMHNESGCNIMIQMRKHDSKHIEVMIRDDGTGADEATIKNLNKKLKKDYLPEHGLGLRIVKQIAVKYKYRLEFKSVPGEYFETDIIM